ncbi:uncharacterized protein LOC131148399 [Malania oleifera]|uniref:uncharacterized protein LOC131148399 n=1 Tax=Malania oleifera TaxID=397392 RepID=UPI0025AE969C|nr:uncharacterized protein LOC131148399 [Malania oleifera]
MGDGLGLKKSPSFGLGGFVEQSPFVALGSIISWTPSSVIYLNCSQSEIIKNVEASQSHLHNRFKPSHSNSVSVELKNAFKGRDKDCILVSFVRSSENPMNRISSLLGDWHKNNVALTHAKAGYVGEDVESILYKLLTCIYNEWRGFI